MYCHTCKKAYDHRENSLCPKACQCCRFPDCPVGSWVRCNDCNRMFKSQACFDWHKQSSANRSVQPWSGVRNVIELLSDIKEIRKSIVAA